MRTITHYIELFHTLLFFLKRQPAQGCLIYFVNKKGLSGNRQSITAEAVTN